MILLAVIIAITAYAATSLIVAKMTTTHLAWLFAERDQARYGCNKRNATPGGDQWFGAAILGICLGACWPIAVLVGITPAPKVGAAARAEKEQHKQRIEALERRNRELEREAGIGR